MVDTKDSEAFKAATRGVKRLKLADRAASQAPKPRPKAKFSKTAPTDQAFTADGDMFELRKPGLRDKDFRALRRGLFTVEDEIDLHGLSAREAESYLRNFIVEACGRGFGCVLIVHGKGRRSGATGPVLKTLTWRLLAERDDVQAAVPAKEKDGGSGAVYVLLRG